MLGAFKGDSKGVVGRTKSRPLYRVIPSGGMDVRGGGGKFGQGVVENS